MAEDERPASSPVIVAIRDRWNVRPGDVPGTTGRAADSAAGAIIVQAGGTDSGPSGAASPTPADGAPTPDEG